MSPYRYKTRGLRFSRQRTRGVTWCEDGHWNQVLSAVWNRQFRLCRAATAASCCVVPCTLARSHAMVNAWWQMHITQQ